MARLTTAMRNRDRQALQRTLQQPTPARQLSPAFLTDLLLFGEQARPARIARLLSAWTETVSTILRVTRQSMR